MSFIVKFTPQAIETFHAVNTQLKQRWGDQFVNEFGLKVSKCLNAIAIAPFMYPVYEVNTEIRKCVLHKNCSMLYVVGN